jgi:hypothetical protein
MHTLARFVHGARARRSAARELASASNRLARPVAAFFVAASLSACGPLFDSSDTPAADTTPTTDSSQAVDTQTRAASSAPTQTVSRNGGAPRSPTAATSGARTATSTVNSLDTLVDDMRLMNDLALAGAPPGPGWATGPGFVLMGNRPRGSATATWWQPYNPALKSDAWWNILLPWMVLYDGVGSASTNTRVEMRNLKAYYLSRSTGAWVKISEGAVDGAYYPKTLTGTDTVAPDFRTEAGGTVSVRPAGGNLAFHGWCCGGRSIVPADVGALFVTMQTRLTVDNPTLPDDRSRARFLVQVGADYYPTASTKIADFAPTGYNPGAGMSRFKLVNNNWQSISFTTLDVAAQDPPGGAITVAQLRSSPPPLE